LKEVGKHPVSELMMVIKSGRYGPYVTDGTINASLPKGMDPESLTIPDAVNLLEARAAKILADGGVTKKRGGRGARGAAKAPKAAKEEKAAKPKKKAAKKKAAPETADAE
ncbi:MAG: DNA topoisomerase I, partial [Deltaproteobacteria bacterium]|nr:DNA topoisomerase I [Deltaproteobacteria bacterium]